MQKHIERAIKIVGTQAELARAIGVTPQFINQMKKSERPIPARLCVKIRQATKGKITEVDIRPDIFSPVEMKEAS